MRIWKSVGRLAAVVVVLVTFSVSGAAATGRPGPQELVEDRSARAGSPGAAWAVVGPGGVEDSGVTGHDGAGAPVDATTPFLWGSVSKPVAATLVVMLADRGLWSLDDRVVDHLPTYTLADPVSRRATVRQLLEHTGGLPEGLSLTDRYETGRTPADVVAEMAELEPVAAPGERHAYSSLGYVVLAAMVTEVTGRPYGEVLAERVLRPAGMTGVPADPAVAADVLPPGHRYVLGDARAFADEVDPTGQAAGYLVGSLGDLAAFARTQLDGGPLLDEESRALLHDGRVTSGPDQRYGLGWRSSTLPGTSEPVVWHGGAAPGYTSAILLLPERRRAVVVLQNAYGPFHEAALLDTAFGLAALVAEEEPGLSEPDPTYPALLVSSGLLAVVLLVAAAASVRGLLRPVLTSPEGPRPRGHRVARAVGGVLLAVAVVTLMALPAAFGVPFGHLVLWAPDVAWLVQADLLLAAVVAVLLVAATARRRLSRRGGPGRRGRAR